MKKLLLPTLLIALLALAVPALAQADSRGPGDKATNRDQLYQKTQGSVQRQGQHLDKGRAPERDEKVSHRRHDNDRKFNHDGPKPGDREHVGPRPDGPKHAGKMDRRDPRHDRRPDRHPDGRRPPRPHPDGRRVVTQVEREVVYVPTPETPRVYREPVPVYPEPSAGVNIAASDGEGNSVSFGANDDGFGFGVSVNTSTSE